MPVKYQNPTFDKGLYWKRREHGWRGQYDYPVQGTHHWSPDWPPKPVTKKAFLKNTKRARKEA